MLSLINILVSSSITWVVAQFYSSYLPKLYILIHLDAWRLLLGLGLTSETVQGTYIQLNSYTIVAVNIPVLIYPVMFPALYILLTPIADAVKHISGNIVFC